MPLQRSARGLPSHLGLFLGGTVPLEFTGEVQAQISAEDFLNPFEVVSAQASITGVGITAVTGTVPEGEIWRIRYMGCNATNAASNIRFRPVVSNGTVFFGVDQLVGAQATAGTTFFGGTFFPIPHVMLPGWQIGWNCAVHTAGTHATESMILRQRIEI